MSMEVNLTVNSRLVRLEVEERTLLSDLLREHCGLTGTHRGCDTAQCGACTVHVNGKAFKSCNLLAAQADGAEVVTIEGIAAASGELHPMQEAFRECHGLQCGFCTPGMVMSAIDLARRCPDLDARHAREGLEGNLCRCTGYENIVQAVVLGARRMRG
jgi:carbon-monoxide dehydrogenase small subunit